MALIESIYIRAQKDGGEWATFSLKELLGMGKAHIVVAWLVERLVDAQENDEITDEMIETMVQMLPKDVYYIRREDVPDRRTKDRGFDRREG